MHQYFTWKIKDKRGITKRELSPDGVFKQFHQCICRHSVRSSSSLLCWHRALRCLAVVNCLIFSCFPVWEHVLQCQSSLLGLIPPLQSCFSRGKVINLGGHGWERRREKGDISYVNKDSKWEIVCFRWVCIKVEKKWTYPTGRKKQGWMIMSHREPHMSQIATLCSAEDGLPLCSCGVRSIQERPC